MPNTGSVCSYKNCKNIYSKCQNTKTPVRFFSYPIKDDGRCLQWIVNSGQDNLLALPREKLRNRRVCSKHFSPRQILNKSLVHDAVPMWYDIAYQGENTKEVATIDLSSHSPNPKTQTDGAVDTFEELIPANPLPTADISPLAVQPTRLRVYTKRPVVPRYEDVTTIVSKLVKRKVDVKKCRLCMGESRMPMIPIFKGIIIKANLSTKIFAVTGLSVVEGDGLPDYICQPCNKNIVNWYDFKQLCITSDAKYRKKTLKKKGKAKKSKHADSALESQTEPRSAPDSDPVEVKLEIEEHNIFETSAHFLDSSRYEYEDFERSPPRVATTSMDETSPPPFASVKVEPLDDESMWNPEVTLNDKEHPKDNIPSASSTLPDDEFTGNVPETPLVDPLSIPTTAAMLGSSPPVINPPSVSTDKPTSYLLAVKSLTASSRDPPTYVLAINPPTSRHRSAFPGDIAGNVTNLPMITNVPVPLNIMGSDKTKRSDPSRQRDSDPSAEDSAAKKFKDSPGID